EVRDHALMDNPGNAVAAAQEPIQLRQHVRHVDPVEVAGAVLCDGDGRRGVEDTERLADAVALEKGEVGVPAECRREELRQQAVQTYGVIGEQSIARHGEEGQLPCGEYGLPELRLALGAGRRFTRPRGEDTAEEGRLAGAVVGGDVQAWDLQRPRSERLLGG